MQSYVYAAAAAVLALGASAAQAQVVDTTVPEAGSTAAPAVAAAPPEVAPQPGASNNAHVAPAGMVIVVEVDEDLSSRVSRKGDTFVLRLRVPVIVDGKELIPAGTPGRGEVVDAGQAGMAGKGGKLLLAARYLELNGQRIPIRTLRMDGGAGVERTDLVMAMSIAGGLAGGVAGMFVKGGEVIVPRGAVGTAKLTDAFVGEASPSTTAAAPAAVTAAPTAAAEVPAAAAEAPLANPGQ